MTNDALCRGKSVIIFLFLFFYYVHFLFLWSYFWYYSCPLPLFNMVKINSSQPVKKRSSSRVQVISKAMRKVDEETRLEARSKRLIALEADNYNEHQQQLSVTDDAYEDEDDQNNSSTGRKGIPKKKKSKSGHNGARAYKIRSLDRVIDHQRQLLSNGDKSMTVCYASISAPPSMNPARHFCSVCGYFGNYTCTRCGMRFCCIKCNKNHKETRCLKMSIF